MADSEAIESRTRLTSCWFHHSSPGVTGTYGADSVITCNPATHPQPNPHCLQCQSCCSISEGGGS
jgi:hypothetical protein